MKRLSHHAFRIFLHLSKVRTPLEERAFAEGPADETLPSSWIPVLGASLEQARNLHTQRDWLGYESELLRLCAFAFSALEAHQRKVGSGPYHVPDRWYWEGVKASGMSIGASATKGHAMAQAEGHLRPGEAYRVGRLAVSPVRRYVPKTEWLTEQMRRRAQAEHDAPDIAWPHLDLQQHRDLQDLLDGLLTAFFEGEGALPDFTHLVDWELRTVPSGTHSSASPLHP